MFKFWKSRKHFDYSQVKVDMHSHLIPGIDDGSQDLKSSISLIKGLSELGFKKLITTPHIMWDMYKNLNDDILSKHEELAQVIKNEGVDIELEVAAEYFLDDYVKDLLKAREPLLTFGDKYILVEFSMASEPIDLREILFELVLQGYQPVIAHPERYIYPMRGKHFFDELRTAGYLFQLNILSLLGVYGKEAYRNAHYLAAANAYEFVGTDLHNEKQLSALDDPGVSTVLNRLIDSGNLRNPFL